MRAHAVRWRVRMHIRIYETQCVAVLVAAAWPRVLSTQGNQSHIR